MKKRITMIVLSSLLLIMQFLPFGASVHSIVDNTHNAQYYSFFHLAPLMNGNFAPFVVAVLSAVLFMLSIIYSITKKKQMEKPMFLVACIAMLLSFCPLFYCIQCFNLVACLISLILFIQTMMLAEKKN